MNDRFPAIVIFVTAAAWFGFAIWLGVNPRALLTAFGVDDSTPQMLTEIRAFYGGVEMAIGMSMIILWRIDQPLAALLVGGLPLAGAASGRCLGILLDGFSAAHLGFLCLEIAGVVACGLAARRLQSERTHSS